jgi:hypothetical protein
MKNFNIISLHVKNGSCTSDCSKPINPAHKLYCIAKYIFKRCKYKYELNYKPVGYEFYFDSFRGNHILRLFTFNKKTKEKDYCTMGLYITNIRHRPWVVEKSQTGLYITFVSHGDSQLHIPFTYDMFDLFKELKHINIHKRIDDLSIEEIEKVLYERKLKQKESLLEKHKEELIKLDTYLSILNNH